MTQRIQHIIHSKWLIVMAFLLLVGPFALDYNLHYPDEQYYTDAAIKMVESHDYLTPQLGSNELRFKKPILTYWVVLAGHQLFGVNTFASRLFFLLAGVLLILLVYRIGFLISEKKEVALLSAFIIASNPTVMISASRSIPDILLCLFMALASLGFVGLIKFGNNAPRKYVWCLYLGIALAFESKGLPALAIGGIGVLFLLFNPWQQIALKKLLYAPALFSGILIAASWFVAMYYIHGSVYLDSFLGDQVGNRVASNIGRFAGNLAMAIGFMLLLFLPWILMVFKRFKSNINSATLQQKSFHALTAICAVSIVVMSVFVSKFYERYLLPVFPLVAVSIALVLNEISEEKRIKVLRPFGWALIAFNLVLFALGLFLNAGIGANWFGWILITIAPFVLWFAVKAIRQKRQLVLWNAVLIMLIIFTASLSMRPISFPGEQDQLRRFVKAEKIPPGSEIAFVGNLQVGAKMRLALANQYPLTTFPDSMMNEIIGADYLLVEDKHLEKLESKKVTQTATINWDPVLVNEIFSGIINRNYNQVFQANGKRYYWVKF